MTAASTDIPVSDVRRRLRQPLYLGGFFLVVSLGLIVWGYAEWRQEKVLGDGPRVEAEVVDTDYRRRRPDVVVVRYEVGGQPYEAEMPADTDGLEPGDRIDIVYDPADPGHARPVRGWSPSYEFLWLVAGAVMIATIGGSAYQRRQARATVRAIESGRTSQMWLRAFDRWAWSRRGHQHVATLWQSACEPLEGRPPDLIVEVDSGAAKHMRDGPATVYGNPKPGEWVVLRADGHTIWPQGKARSELPKRAKPADPT
ncbi:MAG: DUF3592 domain-containing protein [Actinomycetota bacterium]|nr:DUF3592 domain-containing protein [Actinomycetota bacterium]